MAVTDLTDSLPYWARQGGPGPTGGPGAAPMGAGNGVSWLQYLQQMLGPQAAQAGDNPQIAALKAAAAAQANGAPPQAGPGDVPVPQTVASLQPTPQTPGPTQNPTPWFNSGNTPLPWNGPPMRTPATAAPNGPATTAQPPAPTPGPLASGGATGAGASANPRFVQLDQGQNTDPTARNRGPQMTALNLAGLFGGGGAPGAPRGVNPANLPAPAAQTVSGPLARTAPPGDDWDIDANGNVVPNYDTTSKAPWTMGPLQKGNIWRGSGGPRLQR
jgi:hypothetical protein